ncbi:hypothetical protein RhiirB3_450158 [Rhizophagus irregularis]|nr:hypothetical protein RhiirB3_450158 [Rhizophagus irregularis]
MSVANGFPFQWVNHLATLEFFEFLSSFLVLPKRKVLFNRILNRETKNLNTLRDEKLINDQIGIVLALNIKLNAIVSDNTSAYAAAHKTITVAAYFKNANNSYFIGKLRDIQKKLYNKCYSIVIPGKTRWNSHYYCFKSLVQFKQALQNLAIRHKRPQVGSSNTDELYLNSDFCQILLDNNWWKTIELLQDILLPYCSVLNKLQCDKARLFELLHAIGYFVQFWSQFSDPNLGYFNSELNNLSYTSLDKFEDFRKKVEPFNNETFEQFGNDVFKFWSFVEDEYSELGAVALKIFGIRVNAALVKRMWSSMVLAISQLHTSINFSLREKELQQNKAQFLDLNIETEVGDPEVEDSEILKILKILKKIILILLIQNIESEN